MRNPNQNFVILQVNRYAIADHLNEILIEEVLSDGDDRLTDEVCQAYADEMGEWEGEGHSAHDIEELELLLAVDTVRSIGLGHMIADGILKLYKEYSTHWEEEEVDA